MIRIKDISSFTEYLRKIKTPASTIKTYESIIRGLILFTRFEMTEDKIAEFIILKHEKYYLGAIRKFLRYMKIDVNWDKIRTEVKSIKKRDIPSRELSFEEIKILVDGLKYPYNKVVLLQFEFGARIREILNIKCENLIESKLENEEETIKAVLRTKGNKSRVVFTVSKKATKFLKGHINKKGLLFPRELFVNLHIENHDKEMIEERITRSVYWVVWHTIKIKALEFLGKNLATHWFRHSRITYLYEKGWDIRTIQRFTGHSSLDMVEKYLTSAGMDARKLATEEKRRGEIEW